MSLELVRLSKTYTAAKQEDEVEVLREIDYRIEDGAFISIIGPSGCGKTTLLSIISGLEKATGNHGRTETGGPLILVATCRL